MSNGARRSGSLFLAPCTALGITRTPRAHRLSPIRARIVMCESDNDSKSHKRRAQPPALPCSPAPSPALPSPFPRAVPSHIAPSDQLHTAAFPYAEIHQRSGLLDAWSTPPRARKSRAPKSQAQCCTSRALRVVCASRWGTQICATCMRTYPRQRHATHTSIQNAAQISLPASQKRACRGHTRRRAANASKEPLPSLVTLHPTVARLLHSASDAASGLARNAEHRFRLSTRFVAPGAVTPPASPLMPHASPVFALKPGHCPSVIAHIPAAPGLVRGDGGAVTQARYARLIRLIRPVFAQTARPMPCAQRRLRIRTPVCARGSAW
ncbi:hypothetical protein B0H15DRAFT_954685 [Mycena belliarum]|uniref:Uncharacterized protein n=1 Tax=Mycena belliarum TaxID=1033014 RepID=A0AAD6TVS8_9AGAR|nr:hypothetical protein B0H15DRAFT_954685 [Mycena belliae]